MKNKLQIQVFRSDKKEPNIKISLMREIALKGKQTKPQLRDGIKIPYTSIDNTLVKDSYAELAKRLFFRSDSITRKNVEQPQISLTSYASCILMFGHYRDNEDNIKKGISGKPYLNSKEFCQFISIFDEEHNKSSTHQDFDFEQPSNTKSIITSFYLQSNPQSFNELIFKFKEDKAVNNLNLELNTTLEELEKLKFSLKKKKFELYDVLLDNILTN